MTNDRAPEPSEPTHSPLPSRHDLVGLAHDLVGAWGCWAPTLTADGRRVAYVSDRGGQPQLWVQGDDVPGSPRRLALSDDPVLGARWSPDGQWVACSVATGGGVRTEVWVVRPDGSDARRVAGAPEHAILGPWSRTGHRLVVTVCGDQQDGNRSALFDPATGERQDLVAGPLLQVLDFSDDERFLLLRDGSRGAHRCTVFDRSTGREESLLPYPGAGSTEMGVLRPTAVAGRHQLVAYLVTDAGLPRLDLVAVPIGGDGRRDEVGTLAGRPDADLELVDADAHGRLLLLVWNVEGSSEVELFDVATRRRRRFEGMPGTVVAGAVLSRNGNRAVLALESPQDPRRLWELDVADGSWAPLTDRSYAGPGLVRPTLERLVSHDGLEISGWLYRPSAGGAADRPSRAPAVIYLHGGPEAQERPAFSPQHQLLVAAGLVVFAPNIRGSSGYGRTFVHADDRFGRVDAIDDVASCAAFLVERGLASARSIAVAGRSYGGYAVLMALALHPDSFAAGVDICGMSDLLTFYRDTEPWIARAAVTKYGDPEQDAWFLASVSPMRHLDTIRAPLLVIHGALDSNVPPGEAHQLVAALRSRGRSVEYLELEHEGHEYQRQSSRLRVLEAIVAFLRETVAPGEVESPDHSASSWPGSPERAR